MVQTRKVSQITRAQWLLRSEFPLPRLLSKVAAKVPHTPLQKPQSSSQFVAPLVFGNVSKTREKRRRKHQTRRGEERGKVWVGWKGKEREGRQEGTIAKTLSHFRLPLPFFTQMEEEETRLRYRLLCWKSAMNSLEKL